MTLSPAQVARRLEGITATDVAAIVGVHPDRSSISVWQEKHGLAPRWTGNDRTKWGDLLEPVIRSDYAERHAVRVEVPGTVPNNRESWMLASPDGIVFPYASADPDRGLEIKTHTWRLGHLYGAPGTDEIPLWEICQCAWGMAVTGLPRWDHVVFMDGQPVEYIVDRDEELIGHLRQKAERFYRDCVIGDAVPEPDGSDAFADYLKRRWDQTTGKLIDLDSGEWSGTRKLIAEAKIMHHKGEALEREMAPCVQQLKKMIADADGFTWKDDKGRPQKITWKHNKPTERIAVSTMAQDMRSDARLTLSSTSPVLARAKLCLAAAGTTPVGENTRAAIDAREVLELVDQLAAGLVRVADRTEDKYTTEIPGNRPFCWPRSWSSKTNGNDKEQG